MKQLFEYARVLNVYGRSSVPALTLSLIQTVARTR